MMLLLFVQGHYGILVEVENENDNKPQFQPETVKHLSISEVNPTLNSFFSTYVHRAEKTDDRKMKMLLLGLQLVAVNSVVFTVKAVDADGDTLTYSIDRSSVRTPHTTTASIPPAPSGQPF